MIKRITPLVCSLLLLIAMSCKENEEIQPIEPTPPPTEPVQEQFTLSVKPITGLTATSLTAQVTAEKATGGMLYISEKINLTFQGGMWVSDKINLDKGSYKLIQLLIKDQNNNVVGAMPLATSPKGAANSNTLPLSFTQAPLTIESTPVNETDLPEEFGYNSETFGERPYIRIIAKSVIYVAGVQYTPDTHITINAGEWTKQVPNNTEVLLPKKYSNYHFAFSAWSLSAAKDITLEDLKQNPTVILESSSVPKRLKTEEVSRSVDGGGTVVMSKVEYTYNQYNQVSEINYYQKKSDSDQLELALTRKFTYSNFQLVLINHFEGDGTASGYTIISYDALGRTKQVEEKSYDVGTSVIFTYHANGNIDGSYVFSNNRTMSYNMKYTNSNKVEDAAFGNTSETGTYTYDDKINPYYFLNYPDLFLSRNSKNNKVAETKNYGGNIPMMEVYNLEYHYDAQAYPDLLIRSYRGFGSKQHLFKEYVEYTYEQ